METHYFVCEQPAQKAPQSQNSQIKSLYEGQTETVQQLQYRIQFCPQGPNQAKSTLMWALWSRTDRRGMRPASSGEQHKASGKTAACIITEGQQRYQWTWNRASLTIGALGYIHGMCWWHTGPETQAAHSRHPRTQTSCFMTYAKQALHLLSCAYRAPVHCGSIRNKKTKQLWQLTQLTQECNRWNIKPRWQSWYSYMFRVLECSNAGYRHKHLWKPTAILRVAKLTSLQLNYQWHTNKDNSCLGTTVKQLDN